MVCLLSTVHDPAGKLANAAGEKLSVLKELYSSCVFLATDKTHPRTKTILREYVTIAPTDGMANARRLALSIGYYNHKDVFHFCDFDRILFWVSTNPDELKWLIESAVVAVKFIILQRTTRAFESHPLLQRVTEKVINQAFSNGIYIDYLSGSRIIPARFVPRILRQSKVTNGAAIDIEWAKIIGEDDTTWWACDGLAYEHTMFDIEKPPIKEIVTRLDNMVSALSLKWQKNG
jgi:hypothetical protein